MLLSRIEHLYLHELENFAEAIFGRLMPLIVVITTPNAEFNVMFSMANRKFRHPDHKFEWTRQEFENW